MIESGTEIGNSLEFNWDREKEERFAKLTFFPPLSSALHSRQNETCLICVGFR